MNLYDLLAAGRVTPISRVWDHSAAAAARVLTADPATCPKIRYAEPESSTLTVEEIDACIGDQITPQPCRPPWLFWWVEYQRGDGAGVGAFHTQSANVAQALADLTPAWPDIALIKDRCDLTQAVWCAAQWTWRHHPGRDRLQPIGLEVTTWGISHRPLGWVRVPAPGVTDPHAWSHPTRATWFLTAAATRGASPLWS